MGVTPAAAQMTSQTADMTVTGTIVPAACSASFENDGVVDFKTIRLVDLPAKAYYSLGSKNVALNVSCSANKSVSFTVADAQSASRVADAAMVSLLNAGAVSYILGLGTGTAGGKPVNLGGYAIDIDPASTDTGGKVTIYSNGSGWSGSGGWERVLPNGTTLFSVGTSTTVQATGRIFRFPLIVKAGLNTGDALQVAQDTLLNGQAVFSIKYQ